MLPGTPGMDIFICLTRDISITAILFYLCVFPNLLGYCCRILMDLPADLGKGKFAAEPFLDRDTV
jgi:hypothetical protein